jgi:pimeloyl-ACP methyl ester carboxylesterase
MRFLWATNEADVRHLLPNIHVPTLVAHAERDMLAPVAQGRYVADRVAGAEFLSLDSDIHLICVSDVLDELARAMIAFLTRVLPPTRPTSLSRRTTTLAPNSLTPPIST